MIRNERFKLWRYTLNLGEPELDLPKFFGLPKLPLALLEMGPENPPAVLPDAVQKSAIY